MKRWKEPLTILALALGAALLMGPTWPRDDAGTPAAQCSFIGSAGSPTLCSTADPLPTAAQPTQSTTDPTGWGRSWFGITGSLLSANAAHVSIVDQTAYAFQASGGNITSHLTTTGGRTWSQIASASAPEDGIAQANAAIRVGGQYLLGGNPSPGPNDTDGLWRSTDGLGTWVNVDIPAETDTPIGSLASQGSTVLALTNALGADQICRSTNSGSTFTCANPAALGQFGSLGVTSPAPNIWLAADTSGNIARSTDDGVTFPSVVRAMGGSYGSVLCISGSVCLGVNGTGNIHRSTDAGVTWTTVFTAGLTVNFRAFTNFGQGVVTVFDSAGSTPAVYRSADFGATWAFQVALPFAPTSNFYRTTGAISGRGIVMGDAASPNGPGYYSPIVGAGETLIAGQSGNRWNIDPSGRGAVYATQGTLGATSNRVCSEPAANTAATVTVTAVAGQTVQIGGFIAYYTTAPAAAQTLTVTAGGANIWLDIVNGANTPTSRAFGFPIQTSDNNTVVFTLPAGGAGVSGRLCAIAAQFTTNP